MGHGVKKNEPEAVRWLTKAAEQGAELAPGLLKAIIKKNQLLTAAEKGNAEAQFEVAAIYRYGQELDNFNYGHAVKQDKAEAVRWYTKAAEQGHAEAQLFLGAMYDNGEGVTENTAEAIRWFNKAAEQSDVSIQERAKHYLNEIAETAKYLTLAQQGDAEAQYNLAQIYDLKGEIKETEALKWYTKAAEQGHANATYHLAMKSLTSEYDSDKALHWITKMAEQGDVEAQSMAGFLYQIQDNEKALYWFTKAAAQGSTEAQAALDEIAKNSKQ